MIRSKKKKKKERIKRKVIHQRKETKNLVRNSQCENEIIFNILVSKVLQYFDTF